MAERNWRDEFEDRDAYGDAVLDVWYRDGDVVGYMDGSHSVCPAKWLKPISKPATYRPYRRGEIKCGDVFQGKMFGNHSMVVCVEGQRDAVVIGNAIFTYQELFDHYTHLDGTPAGMKE